MSAWFKHWFQIFLHFALLGCWFVWILGGEDSPSDQLNAYVNPGVGTMILQVLLGAIFGAIFSARRWFQRMLRVILKWFARSRHGSR